MDTEAGSEADRALKTLATDVEGAIVGRLLAERAELAAAPAAGLTQDDADSLLAFAAEVRNGIAKMSTPAYEEWQPAVPAAAGDSTSNVVASPQVPGGKDTANPSSRRVDFLAGPVHGREEAGTEQPVRGRPAGQPGVSAWPTYELATEARSP